MKRMITFLLGTALCFGAADAQHNQKVQKLGLEINKALDNLSRKQVALAKELKLWEVECQAEGKQLRPKGPNVMGCVAPQAQTPPQAPKIRPESKTPDTK